MARLAANFLSMTSNDIPRHIAIIMDGNGRWAQKCHLPKIFGHRAGAKTVDRIASYCAGIGVEALTLYSFSTENWKRSEEEVSSIMNLLYDYLAKKLKKFNDNNIKLNTIGDISRLPAKTRDKLMETMELTSRNNGMVLNLALNYGGRQEILMVCKKLIDKVESRVIDPDSIDEKVFSKELYTEGLPELDLLIRTSGELRVSNFLLWQIAYAEFFVTKVLWPEFKVADMEQAIVDYKKRNRRFGARK